MTKNQNGRILNLRKCQYEYIEQVRGKYSRTGKLDEIINFYKQNYETNTNPTA